ncbi:hypothetical protein NMG60_11000003 [Bertholletia excelsa]
MSKVYPNATAAAVTENQSAAASPNSQLVLTVWKKSLLVNCNGFTVFDATGNLVFRVDNYNSNPIKTRIILMDASGNSLLTIRRKRLILPDKWLVYRGETAVNPILSVRKNVNLLNTKSLAHGSSAGNSTGSGTLTYEIEGSYTQRCCVVYDGRRRLVAEIKRKEADGGVAIGLDVFRLIIVDPDQIDSAVAMAIVILLDRMFPS